MKKTEEPCVIKPEDDAEIIDTPVTKFWIDNEGILHSAPHPVERTEENIKQSFAILKSRLGNKKYCMISDGTRTGIIPREMRDYVTKNLAEFLKAHAIITCSPAGNMISHVNFFIKKPPYPLRMFTNVKEAREWIIQYC